MIREGLLLLAVAVGISIQCKSGFSDYGGSCYKFILTGNASYNQAQAQCKKFGINVNLATIRCKKENDFVYGMMLQNREYLSLVNKFKNTDFYKPRIHWLNVWIGLHNVKEVKDAGGRHWSGNWFSDDKCNKYRNYAPGEPNNNADYNEGCVDLIHNDPSASQRGKWNDLPCDRPLLGAICEEQTMRSGGGCNLRPCPGTKLLPEPPVVNRDLSRRPAARPAARPAPRPAPKPQPRPVAPRPRPIVNNDNRQDITNNVNKKTVVNNINHDTVINNVNRRTLIDKNPLPVPQSALEKTVEIKTANGFYQQYFTFDAREFLSSLIEYVTKTVEKCQDLRCKELREKEAKSRL